MLSLRAAFSGLPGCGNAQWAHTMRSWLKAGCQTQCNQNSRSLTLGRDVFLIVPDLDEGDFVRVLAVKVVPALLRGVGDADCLALEVVRVLEYVGWVDIGVLQGPAVHGSQRPLLNRATEGPPYTADRLRGN